MQPDLPNRGRFDTRAPCESVRCRPEQRLALDGSARCTQRKSVLQKFAKRDRSKGHLLQSRFAFLTVVIDLYRNSHLVVPKSHSISVQSGTGASEKYADFLDAPISRPKRTRPRLTLLFMGDRHWSPMLLDQKSTLAPTRR